MAIIVAIITLIVLISIWLVVGIKMAPDLLANKSGIVLFLLPVLYGLVGFAAAVMLCIIYNILVKRIGGFRIQLKTL